MAQKSKKGHIVQSALPLFLDHGFKGTSIDLVVKVSGVSKPTIYNHFPDKTALILAVIEYWIARRQVDLEKLSQATGDDSIIQDYWLTEESVLFYALVIGEGRRFRIAARNFWQDFDRHWRKEITQKLTNNYADFAAILDHRLFLKLRDL